MRTGVYTRRERQPEDPMSMEEEASIQGLSAVSEVAERYREIQTDEVTETTGNVNIRQFTIKPGECFYQMVSYDSGTSDVNFEFRTNGLITIVPSHKCLLAHQSVVFRQMFFGIMKDDANIVTNVKIIDATPDEFVEFTKFFYYGETEITAMNVRAISYLTHKYNVEYFERKCRSFLYRMVTLNTVSILWVLPMATMYNYDELRDKCISLIQWNGPLLIECLQFANCSRETLKSLLSINFNDRNEARVFEKCILWAKASCEHKQLDSSSRDNIRNQLGDCFELIHFDRMSPSQFTKCLSEHSNVFLLDEIGKIAKDVKGQDREFNTVPIPPLSKVRQTFEITKPLLRELMHDVDTADVFFTFGSSSGKHEKRIVAHKCILSACSSVFKSDMMAMKKSYTFHITDASYEAYFAFIKMCYGYFTLLKHHAHLSNESVSKVLMLIKQYNVRFEHWNVSVIDNIEDELMCIQDEENIFWLLELSRIHSLPFLHCLCIGRIGEKPDIFSSEAFLALCQESFKIIFPIVLNKCDAATVCDAGLKWAEAYCQRNHMETCGENIQIALGDFWEMIPFGGLKPVQFIRYRRDLGRIFTPAQIENIIDTMANEYETDESEVGLDESETVNNDDNDEGNDSDNDSDVVDDDSDDDEDENASISEGELESLKSEAEKFKNETNEMSVPL